MDYEALAREPISPDQPAGTDLQDEPLYEALDTEIRKSASVTAGVVNWDKVAGLAADILRGRSKHLQVACYLSVALAKKDGLRGLAAGSEVLQALISTHWDVLFPPLRRMRARRNAIQWWSEQIQTVVPALQTENWDQSSRDKFVADLDKIESFLADHLEDAPLLRPMFEEISRLVVCEAQVSAAPIPDEKPAAPVPTAPVAIAAPVSAPAVPEAANLMQDPDKLMERGMEILSQAAGLLMAQDSLTALPIRLSRIAAWLPVNEMPPAQNGTTRIQPPDSRMVDAFKQMRKEGNWRDLLNEAESNVGRFLFWIDLHHFSFQALRGLGKAELASVIADETCRFVERLPGVERLAFSNGMPFADAETSEWLREIKSQQQPSNDATAGNPADGIAETVAAEVAAAQELTGTKSLAPVLTNFRSRIQTSASARDRLYWQLGMCRILLRAQKAHLAAVYVNKILHQVEKYKVCSWDPELAVVALSTVLACVRAQPDAYEDGLGKSILGKIALVNPAKALDYL